jgi:hypothetical protein
MTFSITRYGQLLPRSQAFTAEITFHSAEKSLARINFAISLAWRFSWPQVDDAKSFARESALRL